MKDQATTSTSSLDGMYSDPTNAAYPPTGISFTFHGKNQVTYVVPGRTYEGTYSLDDDTLQLHVDWTDVYFVYDKSNDSIILPGPLFDYIFTKK